MCGTKKRILIAIPAAALLLAGCGKELPELPENAEAFVMGSYTDEADGGAAYGTIEYNGRTYLPYGVLGGTMKAKDTDSCLGYVIQDAGHTSSPDPDYRNERIYTLTDDPGRSYLMHYDISTTLMNPPSFLRAADTMGQDIHTPEFIESSGYGLWENSE